MRIPAGLALTCALLGCAPAPTPPALSLSLLDPSALLDEVHHFDLRVWAATDASCSGAAVTVPMNAPPVAQQLGATGQSVTLTVAVGAKVFAVEGFADAAGAVKVAEGCQTATLERDVPAQVAIKLSRVGAPPPRVAFASGVRGFGMTALFVADLAAGGAPRAVTATPLVGAGADWDLRGTVVAFAGVGAGAAELYTARLDGNPSDERLPASPPVSGVALSPDGRKVAYASRGQIFVVDIGAPGEVKLSRSAADAAAPAWSRDGKSIAWVERPPSSKVVVGAPTGGTPKTLGAPAVVDGAVPAWTDDGKIVVAVGAAGTEDLIVWDPAANKAVRTIAAKMNRVRGVSIRGASVLFVAQGAGGDIWQGDLGGARAAAPLVATAADEDWPTWSDDGARLAFTADRLVYVAASDGSGRRRVSGSAPGTVEVRPRFASPP